MGVGKEREKRPVKNEAEENGKTQGRRGGGVRRENGGL